MLKSIITPKHKRGLSDGQALKQDALPDITTTCPRDDDAPSTPRKSLHKRTKSALSLRSLAGARAKEAKEAKDRKERQSVDIARALPYLSGPPSPQKAPKTRSSNNLAAMLGMKTKRGRETSGKDKENTTPLTGTPADPVPVHTPIWAEFSTQPFTGITTTSKVPLNDRDRDRRALDDEVARYTPSNYSPSKQRNFADYGMPSLQPKRPGTKERPKSMFPPSTNNGLLDGYNRKKSVERVPLADTLGNELRPSSRGAAPRGMMVRSSSEIGKRREEPVTPLSSSPKKPSRVMAAVAAFNGKAKEAQTPPVSPVKLLDARAVEAEFEEVLVWSAH